MKIFLNILAYPVYLVICVFLAVLVILAGPIDIIIENCRKEPDVLIKEEE